MERRSVEAIIRGLNQANVRSLVTPPDEPGWDRGFDGHAEAQRRRIAALPLWARIDWLEETQRLLARLHRAGPAQGPDESST